MLSMPTRPCQAPVPKKLLGGRRAVVPSKPELNNRFAEAGGTGFGEGDGAGFGAADGAGVTAEPDVTTAEPQPVVSAPASTSHVATSM
jgi:hypothetical protein